VRVLDLHADVRPLLALAQPFGALALVWRCQWWRGLPGVVGCGRVRTGEAQRDYRSSSPRNTFKWLFAGFVPHQPTQQPPQPPPRSSHQGSADQGAPDKQPPTEHATEPGQMQPRGARRKAKAEAEAEAEAEAKIVFPILLGWPVGFGLLWYRAEVWASIAQWVTVGIAAAAAVFALNQVQEARRTRQRQTQPNVVVFADLNPADPNWLDVIVKNFGQTAAYHVRLHFDPWPTVMPWIHPLTGDRVTRLLIPRDIAVLAPGQGWRTLWDEGEARMSAEFDRDTVRQARGLIHPSFEETLPDDVGMRFEGHVVFEDSEHRQYSDPSVLDIHMFFDMRRLAGPAPTTN
jgi:hypothetical protein